MKNMKLLGAVAFLAAAFLLPASGNAQTYRDSGGTILPGVTIVDPASPSGGGTGPLGTAANPMHTTSGGAGGSTAVFPSGGTAGSSNGTGQTDSNAFSVAPSGASIAAWTPPSSCTQPAGFGFQYYLQCLVTGIYAPLSQQTSGNAVGIGGIKLCDQASTANPLTPCATVTAANGLKVDGLNLHASSTALEATHVAKASAGTLYGFYCQAITGALTGVCIAYNSSSAPGTGSLTGSLVLDVCTFSTTLGCSLSRIPQGIAYSAGITVIISNSATPFTYAAGSTGFIGVDYQ